jgi:hypothetical protein
MSINAPVTGFQADATYEFMTFMILRSHSLIVLNEVCERQFVSRTLFVRPA